MDRHKCCDAGRWRLLQVSLLILLVSLPGLLIPTKSNGQIVFTTSASGSAAGDSGSIGESERAALNWVDPCPESSVSAPEGQLIDAGEAGLGMYQNFECDPGGGWRTIFVCIQRCPVGARTTFIAPTPPQAWEVYARIHETAPPPDPRFAPPIDLGGDIKAVVGKRLYVNLTEQSFTEKTSTYFWEYTGTGTTALNGYWYARVLYVPIDYSFTLDGQTAGPCKGPGLSGRTDAGRKAQDAQGCSLVINNRPASGFGTLAVSARWRGTLVTNIPGITQTILDTTTVNVNVPIKELQAVVIN